MFDLADRQQSEKDLAENLHDKLCVERIEPWLDGSKIDLGDEWRNAFADGIFSSRIFVPLLSRKALAQMRSLTPDSPCDNVLLEYRLAIELYVHAAEYGRPPLTMLPVLVGEQTNEISAQLAESSVRGGTSSSSLGVYDSNVDDAARHLQTIKLTGEFYTQFDFSIREALPRMSVKSVDSELDRHLTRFWLKRHGSVEGRPALITSGQTVHETVSLMLEFQAIKLESMGRKQSLEYVVRASSSST